MQVDLRSRANQIMNKSVQLTLNLRTNLTVFLILSLLMTGCISKEPSMPTELILYNWEGDIPQSILDSFTAEYGIKVRYVTYISQEEAIANIRAGEIYDVVVMESRFIPLLVNDGLLAELDYRNILNFRNISPNFRYLVYDPDNLHSIPYTWGTTGLLVRSDLMQNPIQRWSDLWNAHYYGKVGIWTGVSREAIALTLKSLGFSANSENPAELETALARLIELKPKIRFLEDFDAETAAPAMASGEVVIAMGSSADLLASQEMGLPVEYVMPEDGALLWGDTFVVPANSPNHYTAELFLNFLLRPEVSAEIANQNYYAPANESAWEFLDPQILNNPANFPDQDALQKAEIILPLSADGQKLYDEIWQRFLEADPQ
jgi:spermidine/putrescine transport system substrate-binding protein